MRKRRPRGRAAKAQKVLRAGLAQLLEAARASGLVGFAEGDLAELASVVEQGLPEGHALVLVESTIATDHPLVGRLAKAGCVADLGRVSVDRGGAWQGLQALVGELNDETGVGIDGGALDMLARRTLRVSQSSARPLQPSFALSHQRPARCGQPIAALPVSDPPTGPRPARSQGGPDQHPGAVTGADGCGGG